MSPELPSALSEFLERCSPEERALLFRALRADYQIHAYEAEVGASAEMILEAVHRAPELTRRMLRGVIADAAFRMRVVPLLEEQGWEDITPEGNWAYDYKLRDDRGSVSVQVKLQRSEKGKPVIKPGKPYGFEGHVYITETQKTRTGTKKPAKEAGAEADLQDAVTEDQIKTRPYRYGEFDILAVSMQPSTGKWDRYMYTLGRWLLVGKQPNEMATMQPVSMSRDEWWTDDFQQAVAWFRREDFDRRMQSARKKPGRKKTGAKKAPKRALGKAAAAKKAAATKAAAK